MVINVSAITQFIFLVPLINPLYTLRVPRSTLQALLESAFTLDELIILLEIAAYERVVSVLNASNLTLINQLVSPLIVLLLQDSTLVHSPLQYPTITSVGL